jgi:hypothetical protein
MAGQLVQLPGILLRQAVQGFENRRPEPLEGTACGDEIPEPRSARIRHFAIIPQVLQARLLIDVSAILARTGPVAE